MQMLKALSSFCYGPAALSYLKRHTIQKISLARGFKPESCTNYLMRLEAPRYDTWCKIQVKNWGLAPMV